MFLTIFALLLSVSSAVFEKKHYENDQPAIVFAEIASVKAEPKNEATVAFMLHEGTKVYIQERLDNWIKIQLADGTDGWIEKEDIKELK
jgi:SH3-like domain-containing protein